MAFFFSWSACTLFAAFVADIQQKYEHAVVKNQAHEPQHMFSLKDKSLHEDVIALITYATRQNHLNAVERDKISRFLSQFFKDYFGLDTNLPASSRRIPLRTGMPATPVSERKRTSAAFLEEACAAG